MKKKTYRCKTCKISFSPIFRLQEFDKLGKLICSEDVEFDRVNCCPRCGNLLPETINYIRNYFEIIHLSEELDDARDLFLKSELVGAVREAVIKFENIVRKKSGLKDLKGVDLMAKAFSFKFDQNKGAVTEEPKIKVTDLSTVAKRNEQEGVKFMSMGLMQGIRNIYTHHEGNERLFYCLQIITVVDLLLKQIKGGETIACNL